MAVHTTVTHERHEPLCPRHAYRPDPSRGGMVWCALVMSDDRPVCKACGHLYVVNKSDAYWRWLCMASPMPKWLNFVTGEFIADPPYALCKTKNYYGDCPDYEPGINSLSPDKLNPDGTPIK